MSPVEDSASGGSPSAYEPDRFGLAGTTVAGKFRVERVVAEGGFGVVYAGTQLSLDAPIALKLLKTPPEFNDKARASWIEMFAREAKTVARLRHPYIVQVLDYGVVDLPTGERAPWMALEWLAGKTLANELRARRGLARGRSVAEALDLMRPVLEAVAFAHDHGIAHRDLKPENIMLVPNKRGAPLARLMDFGIAKAMSEGEQAPEGATRTQGYVAFSPEYVAPEQLTRTRTGPWTDVHALGLILTEVLTDQPPYENAADPTSRYTEVLSQWRPSPRRRGIDVGSWEAVLTRAMSLRPADRYTDASALLAALAAAVPGVLPRQSFQPSFAPAVSTPEASSQPTQHSQHESASTGPRPPVTTASPAVMPVATSPSFLQRANRPLIGMFLLVLGVGLVMPKLYTSCMSSRNDRVEAKGKDRAEVQRDDGVKEQEVKVKVVQVQRNDGAEVQTPNRRQVEFTSLIPQAEQLARQLNPQARLTSLTAFKIRHGVLDLTTADDIDMTFEWSYSNPAKPPGADLVKGSVRADVKDGRWNFWGHSESTSLDQPAVRLETVRCPSDAAWRIAVQSGIPEDAVADFHLKSSKLYGRRPLLWLISVDAHDEYDREIDASTDKCTLVHKAR
ncbi:MAG TPA: serine/threonine-protein kinase [Polyangiaceae bacterium]|nr:serine/threonine-protein kinase [Polyangiaceae bacterium]